MRLGFPAVLSLVCACESATTPVLPASADYRLVAATENAYPSYTDGQWRTLPFQYDITGNGSCQFEIAGAVLHVTGRRYTIDLQQSVVRCDFGTQPAAHESGTLAEVHNASDGSLTGDLAFTPTHGDGWVSSGRAVGKVLYLSIAPPGGGAVNYLQLHRVE